MIKNRLYRNDCLKGLEKFPDNHFTAIVTDPPAGINFMGLDFDKDKGGRDSWINWMCEIAKECLRVVKPGAHVLVWALPRTSHWTATAWENAGWEVRDKISHIFAQGFPKSLSVSLKLDQMVGAKRKIVCENPGSVGRTTTIKGNNYGRMRKRKGNIDKYFITKSATKKAKQYDGYGTGLKPAIEDWILLRAPISEKTIVKNILKWGTGCLNIDGARIQIDPKDKNLRPKGSKSFNKKGGKTFKGITGRNYRDNAGNTLNINKGRWPANVIFDECAACLLNKQSGIRKGWSSQKHNKFNPYGGNALNKSATKRDGLHEGYNDSGGASRFFKVVDNNDSFIYNEEISRFFFCAKASPRERAGNKHPTVKPVRLLEYLIKLVTLPEFNLILDPFMGSGSTAIACENLGIDWIGFEKDKEYCKQARNRIQYYGKKRKLKK